MKSYNYFVIQDSSGEIFPFLKLKNALSFADNMEESGFSVTIEVFVEI